MHSIISRRRLGLLAPAVLATTATRASAGRPDASAPVEAIRFPPYGIMPNDLLDDDKAPASWHADTDWPTWLRNVRDLLAHVLWPRWDRDGSVWVGASATRMTELTRADFTLLRDLRPLLATPAASTASGFTHERCFRIEDEPDVRDDAGNLLLDRNADFTLRRYLSGLAAQTVVEALCNRYIDRVFARTGACDIALKADLQRPRPYQMALLMGEAWFTHVIAKYANSPAMISGHTLSGAMGGVAARYALLEHAHEPAADRALMQHTVDVGDRRVLAGVHYPSDNIGSWITALLLCTATCPDHEGAAWLWQAIRRQSRVHAAVMAHAATHPGSPYGPSLAVLAHLGERPGMPMSELLAFARRHG